MGLSATIKPAVLSIAEMGKEDELTLQQREIWSDGFAGPSRSFLSFLCIYNKIWKHSILPLVIQTTKETGNVHRNCFKINTIRLPK